MDTDRSRDQSDSITAGLSRRAALGHLAGAGVAAALLATAGRDIAQATSGPQGEEGEEPNHFVLAGGETQVTYDAAAFAGEPQLTYRGPIGLGDERTISSQTFVGDEVRTEESALFGRLVTVHLGAFPDAAIFELTLLLPEFNPISVGDAPIPFATLAILTTHLTTVGGPRLLEGALREYEAVALRGTAQLVVS